MPHPYARRRRRPGKARLGTPGGHVGTPRLGRPVEGEGLARRIPRRRSAEDRLTLTSLAENLMTPVRDRCRVGRKGYGGLNVV